MLPLMAIVAVVPAESSLGLELGLNSSFSESESSSSPCFFLRFGRLF